MINKMLSVAGIVLAGVYLYATSRIPVLETSDPLGPKAFPVGLAIVFIICCVGLFVEGWRYKPAAAGGALKVSAESRPNIPVVAGMAVWIAIYFFLFERAGFMVAASVFLLPAMLYFHKEGRLAAGLTSIGFSIGTYVVFSKLLHVRLPSGILGF